MFGLMPKGFEKSKSANNILRVHLSQDGVNSICKRGNPDKMYKIERPKNSKYFCVFCLMEEQRILHPAEKKSSVSTGFIYNIIFKNGNNHKEYPQYYTKHWLDKNGVPFCKRVMANKTDIATDLDIPIRNCEKCLFIIESLEALEQ
jgi:hypothetical protein